MLNEKIGMKAKITLQPTIHNMTWVKDPFGGESSYVTTGTSKYFEVAFVWLVTPDWEYTLGHVYKTYYFKPVADNYNLTINYDGLFIETTCKF